MSYTLGVPNTEVSTVFSTIIRGWINDGPVKNDRLEMMLQALDENDIEAFEEILNEFVVNTLSYYDTNGRDPRRSTKPSLLGMLVSHGSYKVSSNRESGLSRYDILMCPVDVSRRGYIMELKRLRMSSTVGDDVGYGFAANKKTSDTPPRSMRPVCVIFWRWPSPSMANVCG